MLPDAEQLAEIVTTAIKVATSPLVARIAVLEKSLAALPTPKDGVDGKDGAPGRDGADGASFDPEQVDTIVASHLTKALSDRTLPDEADVVSAVVKEVTPALKAFVSETVDALPKPKDGIGIVSVFVDRDGQLIQTMTDGSTKSCGVVIGKDVDMSEVNALIVKTLEAWPKPQDGKDGKDGLGFEHLEGVYDEHGRLSIEMRRGDEVKTFRVPGHVHRAVYKPDVEYAKGDTATFAGSCFTALNEGLLGKPGECADWRMIAQRGRDARSPVAVKHG